MVRGQGERKVSGVRDLVKVRIIRKIKIKIKIPIKGIGNIIETTTTGFLSKRDK